MTPCAKWINDCGGKKDYDGPILSISTRYWPSTGGFLILDHGEFVDPPLRKPSARASIGINYTITEDRGYMPIIEQEFEGGTEEEVKRMVESWVQSKFNMVVDLIKEKLV